MTGSPRILLMDDDTAIQRATAPLLRSYGYDVEVAGTAAEALKSFVGRQPDVVILDLGLPDIDGVEVCRRMRAQSETPILVLSARTRRSSSE